MTSNLIHIRPGQKTDLPAIVAVYNYYIKNTVATFDIETSTIQAHEPWFTEFDLKGPYRLLVAEKDNQIIGYACSKRFKERAAYSTSIETTVYIHHQYLGQGVGARIYAQLFTELKQENIHRAYAGATLPNPGSVALHEKFGFKLVGTFHEVGYKFNQYWDVAWYEKAMNE